ncbi:hypothetical protein [Cobetia crustatorum]|nr:hypothetical protein [Cobetia crustatorum]
MTLTSAGLLLVFVLATGFAPDISSTLFGAAACGSKRPSALIT